MITDIGFFYFDFFPPTAAASVHYYYAFLEPSIHKAIYLKWLVPYLYGLSFVKTEFLTESYSCLVYGMPEFLEYALDYSTIWFDLDGQLVLDSFEIPGWTAIAWWWAYFDLMDAAFSSPQPYSDIKAIAFVLYDYMFIHLFVLGFLFFSIIVGVVSLLLSRNLRVRRQNMFDQQRNVLSNHIVQCT